MRRTGRSKENITPEKKQEQRELLRLFSVNIRKPSFHIIIQKNFHLQAQKKSISYIWSFPAIFLLEKKMSQKLIPETSLCLIYELNQECL